MSQFTYSRRDLLRDTQRSDPPDPHTESPSPFDALLCSGWRDRMRRGGVFRYRLGALQTRVLPGPLSLVAQLNVRRGVERRKPQEIQSIKQPYNAHQFNFNKVCPEEVLFEMHRVSEQSRPEGEGPPGGDGGPEPQRVVVLVNVSPLEFGHCLFVPEPSHCLPQVLTLSAIQTGMESVLLSSDPGFRVGFNSLGAFASVNHLHLHGYYLQHRLLLETVPVQPLVPDKSFYRLSRLPRGFLFYAEPDDLDRIARVVHQVTEALVRGDVAHNLFLTRGCPPAEGQTGGPPPGARRGVRVALWPRKSSFGAKEETAFNVALCELAGHLPFKVQQDYEGLTEEDVTDIIQRYLLPDEDFIRLEKQLVADMIDL